MDTREALIAKLHGRVTDWLIESAMGYSERFELNAERFYGATGFLAPGKSEPMEMHGGEARQQRRHAAWDNWNAHKKAEYQQDLRELRALLSQLRAVPQEPPFVCECGQRFPAANFGMLLHQAESGHRAVPQEPGWQPIASAPKDGTAVVVYDAAWCGGKPRISVSYWQWWEVINDGQGNRTRERKGAWSGVTKATHWQPLPAPPVDPPSPAQAKDSDGR